MSNALVKRLCNALEAQSNGELVRREKVPPARRIEAPPPVLPPSVTLCQTGDYPTVIELPRWCSIYDGEMSIARYLWRNGLYVYDDNIELTPAQKRRYSADNAVAVPAGFCEERERCAICGKWTPDWSVGAIGCPRCKPVRVCYGRTPDKYFQCRASCGGEGFLTDGSGDTFALVPGRSRGNFGTQF